MQLSRYPAQVLAGMILLLSVVSANAAWNLDNDASQLNFISIKKDAVAEVHKFTHLAGSVDDQGKVEVTIQLASVDTAVPIRDERMRDMLFQTKLFPTATVTAQVDPADIEGLAVGQSRNIDVPFTLTLHGESKEFKAAVNLVKLQDGGLLVHSIHPLIVDAGAFKLTQGVEELRKVANLSAISTAVPVSLMLVFDVAK